MYSLGSWWGGRYIFSISVFSFPALCIPRVYPGVWPFFVNIFAQFAYQKTISDLLKSD